MRGRGSLRESRPFGTYATRQRVPTPTSEPLLCALRGGEPDSAERQLFATSPPSGAPPSCQANTRVERNNAPCDMPRWMTMTSRAEIERILTEINEAENSPDLTAAERSQVIDTVSAPGVQGWANGVARGGRE